MRAEVNYKDIGQKITELIVSEDMKDFSYISRRTDGAFYGAFLRACSMYDTNTMLLERVYVNSSIDMMTQKIQRFNVETEAFAEKAKERKTVYFEALEALEKAGLTPEEFTAQADTLQSEYVEDVRKMGEGVNIGYEEADAEVEVFKYFDADREKAVCPVFSVQDQPKGTLETYYELIAKQMLSIYDILIYGGTNKLGSGDYYILLHKIRTPQYVDIVAKFLLKDELDQTEDEDNGTDE